MKSPSAKIISINVICCSLHGEDRHRQIQSVWTMNKESQISPQWAYLLRRNAVLAQKPYKIRQASLSQTGKRFVFQSDLCLNQIADSVLTGRRCMVCTVNTEASHIWFNRPLYTVIYHEHVLLYLIPNKWIMDAMFQCNGILHTGMLKLLCCFICCLLEICWVVKIRCSVWLPAG